MHRGMQLGLSMKHTSFTVPLTRDSSDAGQVQIRVAGRRLQYFDQLIVA